MFYGVTSSFQGHPYRKLSIGMDHNLFSFLLSLIDYFFEFIQSKLGGGCFTEMRETIQAGIDYLDMINGIVFPQ